MERPLLLLMTMDTAARNRLAVTLGFSLVHKPFFGQAAAEAAQLLFRKQQGVQVRVQRARVRVWCRVLELRYAAEVGLTVTRTLPHSTRLCLAPRSAGVHTSAVR